MTCYHPLNAYKIKEKNGSKTSVSFKPVASWRCEDLKLPCGQCIGCRLERSRQWGVRCMHEASLHEDNCFLTLTYDEQNLPADGSVHVEHFQRFMKRLRKANAEKKIRFFHCGEYGEKFSRPHYHALLFGHDFADKKLHSVHGEHRLYSSSELSKLWPFGHSLIGSVNFDSARYVAGYCLKKVTGEKAKDHYQGRKPEYVTMSRRPGIGHGWYEKFSSDVYPQDRMVVNGSVTRSPRYYDNLYAAGCPLGILNIKREREKNSKHFVKDIVNGREILESDSSDRRLAVKEVVKTAEVSRMKRSFEEGI